MKLYSSLICLVYILTSVGCASWTQPISKNEIPLTHESYLYGKFQIYSPKAFGGFDGYQTIGHIYKCEDGNKYTIRFSTDDPIQVYKVAPSTCSLDELIYTTGDGQIVHRKQAPKGIVNNLVLKPGIAYYIGDYLAYVRNSSVGTSWRMKSISDSYIETSKEMKLLYHNIANIQTEDAMLEGINIDQFTSD